MDKKLNLDKENDIPPLAGLSILSKSISILSLFLVLLVFWIFFFQVDETAKARGQVVPEGLIFEFESEAGGTIKNIYVKEGDFVKKGQVLVELDKKLIEEELAKEITHKQNLLAEEARITAFVNHYKEIDFGGENIAKRIKLQQKGLLKAQRELMQADLSILQEELAVAQAELKAIKIELPVVKKQIGRAKKARTIIEEGTKKKVVSIIRFIDFMQTESQYYRQLSELEGKNLTTKAKIQQIKNKIMELPKKEFAEALEKRAEVVKELIEKNHVILRLQKQLKDARVISPINGIVFSILNHNPGAVISPGEMVAKVVPTEDTLMIEAKLNPKDIGYVKIGQNARVKIDTFDFSRFGVLNGEVKNISASTFKNKDDSTYYKVYIQLERTFFGSNPNEYQILPGMTSEVDITTGKKTIFQYMWKPVYTLMNTAFSER